MRCPQFGAPEIRWRGLGTQRVEEAVRRLLPRARIERMDTDTMSKKNRFREILAEFRAGKIDVLVGTQMIGKGLDFPNVTLVGLIDADISMHIPDFRANERTFQLLVQVAGRAGRGDVEGEVVVQSFTPFHSAIQYARQHDFIGFYEQEIEFRQELQYPPATRMVCVTVRSRSEEKAKFVAEALAKGFEKQTAGQKDLMGGATPAPLAKVQNQYRYQIVMRSAQILPLVEAVGKVMTATKMPNEVSASVDVDALSLL